MSGFIGNNGGGGGGGGGIPSGSAGGNLSGTYPNPVVAKIQNVAISSTAPMDGYVLTYVAANSDWEAGKVSLSSSVIGTLPASNQASQTLSGDVSGTTAASVVANIQGNPVANTILNSSQDGYALTWVNSSSQYQAKPIPTTSAATTTTTGTIVLTNNLGGTATSPTVIGITLGSDAQGDVYYRGATGLARLPAGTTNLPLVTGGTAANPSFSNSFGANNMNFTTGSLAFGTLPPTSGQIRLSTGNGIVFGLGDGSSGLGGLQIFTGPTRLQLGSGFNFPTVIIGATTTIAIQINSGTTQTYRFTSNAITIDTTVSAPSILQAAVTTASATAQTLTIQAQNATGTTSTGGDLLLSPGTGTTSNGRINLNNLTTTTTAPAAGAASALPATPTGYLTIKVNGVARQLAYY